MATLWDKFDSLLKEGETDFLNYHFARAVEKWESYFKITAKLDYAQIINEIKRLLLEVDYQNIKSPNLLLSQFRKIRQRFMERRIHKYTYKLFLNLLKKIYSEQFADKNENFLLLHGIFHYLLEDYHKAEIDLKNYLQIDFENVEARIFLGHVHLAEGNQRKAIVLLTQNLFLAADQLYGDDLYLSQFKLLFGRLYSQTGRHDSAAWLLTFEAWYRNFLVLEESDRFYKLMVLKEQNERIIRVKYTAAERYRHFARCLFVAEYSRLFLKNKQGIIQDQEKYMEQLDAALFKRYRRKRKPPKS